jgi:hypothetical protein
MPPHGGGRGGRSAIEGEGFPLGLQVFRYDCLLPLLFPDGYYIFALPKVCAAIERALSLSPGGPENLKDNPGGILSGKFWGDSCPFPPVPLPWLVLPPRYRRPADASSPASVRGPARKPEGSPWPHGR